MSSPLASVMKRTELPNGVHYLLPSRQLGGYHGVGLALLIFGSALCCTPIIPFWKIIQSFFGQVEPGYGLLWLGAFIISISVCQAGLYVAPVGLFILAGHSEVELRDGIMYSIECCGPVRWRWERSTAEMRRLFVSDGLEPLNLFGRITIGPLGTLGVITPEWKAVVGSPSAKSMWLAPGYPREWLVALAEELARRCTLSEAKPVASTAIQAALPTGRPLSAAITATPPPSPQIPVLQRPPDFSDYEELTEQPAGSKIQIERSTDGLTLTVPPLGMWHSLLLLLAGLLLWFGAYDMTRNYFFDDLEPGDQRTGFFAVVLWIAGAALVALSVYRALRGNLTFRVVGARLLVTQIGLFRKEWCWEQKQLADIFVQHYPDSEGPDRWELQIHPVLGAGEVLQLLGHHDVNELRWLATMLRRELDCPGKSLQSPPAGLVVSSPYLAWRFSHSQQ